MTPSRDHCCSRGYLDAAEKGRLKNQNIYYIPNSIITELLDLLLPKLDPEEDEYESYISCLFMAAVTRLEAVRPREELDDDMEEPDEEAAATAADVNASVCAYRGAAAAVAWLMATRWASDNCFLK